MNGESSAPAGRLQIGSIDFGALLKIFRRQWLLLAIVPVMFFAVAVVALRFMPYRYMVSMDVVPTPQNTSIGALSNISRLQSLAGLGGGSSDQASPLELYQKGLLSRLAADRLFVERPAIVREIFSDEWSESEQKWVRSESFEAVFRRTFKAALGLPGYAWEPPSGNNLHYFITRHVRVVREERGALGTAYSPIITISTNDIDYNLAIRLISNLHQIVDDTLRQRALARANSNIDYLQRQIDRTTNNDLTAALIAAVVEQDRLRMQASANLPYAAEPFGPPARSLLPVSPKVTLTLAMSLLIGFLVGLVLAFIRDRRVYGPTSIAVKSSAG